MTEVALFLINPSLQEEEEEEPWGAEVPHLPDYLLVECLNCAKLVEELVVQQ